ncbi:MAG TPA: SIS domain-containing protein, partial [Fimbriimonadaceae bacterium]|nr:SIS domain-containing protein [Fimbriimonadaceae bacterium]
MVAQRLAEAGSLLQEFSSDAEALAAIEEIVQVLTACFRKQGRVLVCGNGGSLCDAMHFAEEWSGRFREDRDPYPAIALSDPAHMSCVANDFGFDQVFSRQVRGLGHPGDVLVLLSTSGNSPNIVRAAEAAIER